METLQYWIPKKVILRSLSNDTHISVCILWEDNESSKKKKKCYARSKHLGIKDSDQNHYKNHKLWVWKFLYIPISGFVYESNEKLDYGSRYVFIWGRFLLGWWINMQSCKMLWYTSLSLFWFSVETRKWWRQ